MDLCGLQFVKVLRICLSKVKDPVSPVRGAPVYPQPDKDNSKDQKNHLHDQWCIDENLMIKKKTIVMTMITRQIAFWTTKALLFWENFLISFLEMIEECDPYIMLRDVRRPDLTEPSIKPQSKPRYWGVSKTPRPMNVVAGQWLLLLICESMQAVAYLLQTESKSEEDDPSGKFECPNLSN